MQVQEPRISAERQVFIDLALELQKNTARAAAVYHQVIQLLGVTREEISRTQLGRSVGVSRNQEEVFLRKKNITAQKRLRVEVVNIAQEIGLLEIGSKIPEFGYSTLRRFCSDGSLLADSIKFPIVKNDRPTTEMVDVLTKESFLEKISEFFQKEAEEEPSVD